MTRPTMPMPLVQKVRVKAHKCCGVKPNIDEIETDDNTLCVIRCPKCLRRHTGTYGTAVYNWNYDIAMAQDAITRAVSVQRERERKAADKPVPLEVKPELKEIKMPKKSAKKAVKKTAKKAKKAAKKTAKKTAKKAVKKVPNKKKGKKR